MNAMDFLDQLNDTQRDVVFATEPYLLLNAPAGTGKTKTLACRTAYLMESDRAAGNAILCLTFTNRACKELKKRIITMTHEKGLTVPVKTIHSFCYGLIKEEAKRAGISSDFQIYDAEDCKAIVRAMDSTTYLLHNEPRRLQKLCDFIEAVKKERISYGQATDICSYEDAANTLFRRPAAMEKLCCRYDGSRDNDMEQWLATNGATFVQDYDIYLASNHVLDFSDLITRASLLLTQKDICQRWRDRYDYISVDEVQDTSTIEYALLSHLFPRRHVLLCGDYYQTIYGWRGSDPDKIIQQFKMTCHPKCLSFTVNYRATQTLLHAAESCLCQLFSSSGSALPPSTSISPEKGEPITMHGADTFMDEGRWIFRQLQKIGLPKALKACIMTRTNRYNKEIWNSVRSHNEKLAPELRLPFTMADQFQLFKRQECKDVIAFLRLSLNRHDNTSLRRIVARFADRIGNRTLETITSPSYRQLGITLSDFVDDQSRTSGDPFGLLLDGMAQGRLVIFDVEATGTDTTRDDIIQIAAIRLAPDGSIADTFVTYVTPSKPVGDSFYIHHISDEQLQREGMAPEEALQQFVAFARDAILIGHNVTYDVSIVYSEMTRLGLTPPPLTAYYDTLDIYRRFYPRLENHTLAFLSRHFPIEHQPSHDAFDDILATAGILRYAIDVNIRPATDQRRAAMAMYLSLFTPIASQLTHLRTRSYTARPSQLITAIMNDCHVKAYYMDHAAENHDREDHIDRVENIRQLYRIAVETDDTDQNPRDALTEFLTLTALSNSELDSLLEKKPQIPIITVHQAKGLEFDYVFLACLQEGTFPLGRAENEELSEEKRLFYVALTRAKKRLCLSWHKRDGRKTNQPSRFLASLPSEDVEEQ
jgi:DNA helicase-2/ATP-dependent DNA helicase PcrA